MSNVLDAALKASVQRVTFRSQVTPDYSYDPFAPSAPPSEGHGWLMGFIKPEITVETAAGPIVIAPYGSPTANYAPLAAAGGIATIVGGAYLFWKVAQWAKR